MRLLRSIAPQQLSTKADGDLVEHGPIGITRRRACDGVDQILSGVGSGHGQRQLRSGEDNGLSEPCKHKAQSTGSVGHGVCAVDDQKGVIGVSGGVQCLSEDDPLLFTR